MTLIVKNLSKKIGTFTLTADFSLTGSERAVLVGASGSGKTSLLRIIAGLDVPDSGQVFLNDREITHFNPQQREIGYIFQDQALFPALNVIDNVTFALRVRGISQNEREVQGNQWLKRIGLGSRAHSSIAELSGGERQRVAFARALIWQPKLLLLDEPFSALDTNLRADLRRQLVELHGICPVPTILVTHDEADAVAIAQVRFGVTGTDVRRVGRL